MSELKFTDEDCGYPSAVEDWNAHYPPGTPVIYWTGFRDGEGHVGVTRSEARLMGDDPVVWVTGHGACIALRHVAPIKDQRRALLAHLLKAEGLPGVEEIAERGQVVIDPLKFTDEEGTLFEFFDGQTAIFQKQTSLRQGVKLNISSKCANWDLSCYLSPANEKALLDWLNARESARNGGGS